MRGGRLGPPLRRDIEVGTLGRQPGQDQHRVGGRHVPSWGRREGTGFHDSPEGSHHSLGWSRAQSPASPHSMPANSTPRGALRGGTGVYQDGKAA